MAKHTTKTEQDDARRRTIKHRSSDRRCRCSFFIDGKVVRWFSN